MKIATSILNSKDRIEDVIKLNRTNNSYIHIDVMDGKFVDDIQFKINEISAVNRVSKYPLDVHLMVNDPIKYILELKNMNIEYITFHLEIRRSKEKIISKIKELGYKVGISIKPDTDISKLQPYLKDIDLILIMSVEPGKGGQQFLDSTIDRMNEVKKLIADGGYNIDIEVDGGINDKTITNVSGADIAVVGSYIIKSDNYYNKIEELLKNSTKVSNIVKKVNVSKVRKSILFYKTSLVIELIPFILTLLYGIYSMIFGWDFFGNVSYGSDAFFVSIFCVLVVYRYVFLLCIVLIIFSIIRLLFLKSKLKRP